MNLRTNIAAACGLAGLIALSAPATAATFDYDLVGDGAAAYTLPGVPPAWTFVDLTDTTTGVSDLPGYRLTTGDKIHLTVTLAHPITFTGFQLWLQNTSSANSSVYVDPTSQYFLNGAAEPEPSSNWGYTSGTSGSLGFGATYVLWGSDTFSFDKLILDATITDLTDDSNQSVPYLDLQDGWASITVFDANKLGVATTPVPGSLILGLTSIGGLAFAARRKRKLAREDAA
jgi:hypothetical protein